MGAFFIAARMLPLTRRIGDTRGLSTMIASREIRLKSRLVGMPGADNFELVTV